MNKNFRFYDREYYEGVKKLEMWRSLRSAHNAARRKKMEQKRIEENKCILEWAEERASKLNENNCESILRWAEATAKQRLARQQVSVG